MYSTNTGPNSANNPGANYPFVSAWEKNNGTSNFTLKYGNGASGEFFEGAITNGYPSDATENSVQAELTTAGYGTASGGSAPTGPITSGANSGKCVDDNGLSSANGTKIQIWDCTGGANQSWTVEPNGTLQVYGKCMDITGANYNNGTAIDLWQCNGGTNQQWHLP